MFKSIFSAVVFILLMFLFQSAFAQQMTCPQGTTMVNVNGQQRCQIGQQDQQQGQYQPQIQQGQQWQQQGQQQRLVCSPGLRPIPRRNGGYECIPLQQAQQQGQQQGRQKHHRHNQQNGGNNGLRLSLL